MSFKVHVWDMPTRIFHWCLAMLVIALIISGSIGGNAMTWHFRFGYGVFTLLLFRFVWGFIGGLWSRFSTFLYAPATVLRYLKGQGSPADSVGHNPLGAGSVFALLGILALQVGTGLFSDDEIASSGPLAQFVSSATVSLLTGYHKNVGKLILFALIGLHLCAIAFYWLRKKENLVKPMITGEKIMEEPVDNAQDTAGSRVKAALVFLACAAVVAWVVKLGS